MRTRVPLFALLALASACLLPSAHAGIPLGGLAVTATADGSRLVAGGDSRALYELDPQTLAVKRRVHLGRGIIGLAFSADGKQLWAESTKAVQLLDGTSFKVITTFDKLDALRAAQGTGLVAVRHQRNGEIHVLAVRDGSTKGVIPGRKTSIAAFGLSPDGKQIAVLYGRRRTDTEKKVGYKDLPKDLKGAALKEFKQRNDGYASQFTVYDVATGKALLDKQLWYSTSGSANRVAWHAGAVHVVGYENQNARVDAKGEVTYFELGNSYNYGLGVSGDGSTILSGGLRNGSRTTMSERKGTKFKVDKLPGFPEYFKSFCLTSDGTGFGGTSCWRVIRLDAQGTIVKSAPIY